ncbi:3-coathanger stack domain-containing protein [Jiulongibacter sediminis]|uniref:Uncharacterized protein n=1 Tax=Jiulongibacter sediminis TaxID=1605367 RepID=A0A0P7C234_9BACT|nr:3-coathanger stack domain-containing protein [Jiulongibacter sediminis]KPM48085.1 hypothetical protein AFM12_12925 [Jiulongibacter sediminis]TBX24265.1 hypothetical protein TK44_12935 [Jiulongibacter sediminis]
MVLRFSKRLISVLLFIAPGVLFAQKDKTPLRPFSSTSTVQDTCEVTCSLFGANIDNLISTENLSFDAPVDLISCQDNALNFEPGCLLNYNNQKWLLVKIKSGKDLVFTIENSAETDIDAAIWGPVAQNDINQACDVLGDFPKSCEYTETGKELTLTNVNAGEYYVMLVTNFDNVETTIELTQPEGGEVRYIYLCPSDIVLNSAINGSQNQFAVNSVRISSGLQDSTMFIAHSGNSISLLPGFSTSNNVVFEAKIQACLNNTESYIPAYSEIVCEDFSNHTSNVPHLYANNGTNELVGTVFAQSPPMYSIDQVHWSTMTKIGSDKGGNRYYYAYREPFEKASVVLLKSAEGCPVYGDTRSTYPFTYNGYEDSNIPTLDSVTQYYDLNTPFFISTDVQEPRPNHDVYALYLKHDLPEIGYRINGQNWRYNVDHTSIYEEYNQRYIDVTRINGFTAPKDFILDFTQDAGVTIDRYHVTRSSAGGHFAVTTTFTRIEDGKTWVHTFQGDINVNMKLGEYTSTDLFGNCFFLGTQDEGDTFYPLTSVKGEYTLDEAMLVRVRR